jgi:hypothetical protein
MAEQPYAQVRGYLAHEKRPFLRITIGPQASGYCKVLRGGGVLVSQEPLKAPDSAFCIFFITLEPCVE